MNRITLFILTVVAMFATLGNLNAQAPIELVDGTKFVPFQQGQQVPTSGTVQKAEPLDERLTNAVGELQRAEKAVEQLRGTTAPIPAQSFAPFKLSGAENAMFGILVLCAFLLFVAVVIWAVVQHNRAPQAPQGHQGLVGHIPVNLAVQPLNIGIGGGHIHLGLNQTATAPVGTPCGGCGAPKPSMASRFCANCGHVLPAILMALFLFGFGQGVAVAQNNVQYYCEVNGLKGLCTPPKAAVQVAQASVQAPATPSPAPAKVTAKPKTPAVTMAEVNKAIEQGVAAAIKVAIPPKNQSGVDQNVVSRLDTVETIVNGYAEWYPSVEHLQKTAEAEPEEFKKLVAKYAPASQTVKGLKLITDQLQDLKDSDDEVRIRINELTNKVGRVENRIVSVENQVLETKQLSIDTGNAVLTGSQKAVCDLHKRMLKYGTPEPGRKIPKGCRVQ